MAVPGNWKKNCHMHPSSFSIQVLVGAYQVQTAASKTVKKFKVGGQVFNQKFNPHEEANPLKDISVYLIKWFSVTNKTELTIPVDEGLCTNDELPNPKVPPLRQLPPQDRPLPEEWSAVAILHPYSELQCAVDYTEEEKSNPLFPFVFDFTTAALRKKRSSGIEMYLRHCDNDTEELWLELNETGTFFKNCSSCDLTQKNFNWTLPESDW